MRVAFGCDRNGLDYKERLIRHAKKVGIEIVDVGTKIYINIVQWIEASGGENSTNQGFGGREGNRTYSGY